MSRIEEVKIKYPKLNINIIAKKDPSNNYKYLDWMAREIDKGSKKSDVYGTISGYHTYINAIKENITNLSCRELENKVKDHLSKLIEKNFNLIDGIDYNKRFEDDNALIIEIFSKEAAIKYGKKTRWCISGNENNYFEEYCDERIFFLINKKDTASPTSKIAILINSKFYYKEKMLDPDEYYDYYFCMFDSLDNKMGRTLFEAPEYEWCIKYITHILPLKDSREEKFNKLTINKLNGWSYRINYKAYNITEKELDVFIFYNYNKYKHLISVKSLNCFKPVILSKYSEIVTEIINEKYKFDHLDKTLNNFILGKYDINNNPIKNKEEFDKLVSYYELNYPKKINSFFKRKPIEVAPLSLKVSTDLFLENKMTVKEFKKVLSKNKNKLATLK
jgi:hypothetical protein